MKKFSGLLVLAALCAALVFAVSFLFSDSALRAAAMLGGLVIAALLAGLLRMVANARAARQLAVLEESHELSTLAFPPSNSRAGHRGK